MSKRIKINWEGSFFVHHSLGMVNREIVLQLCTHDDFDIRIIPFEPDTFYPQSDSRLYPLTKINRTPHEFADIHIRHRWPPEFCRPQARMSILFQPWEYGSLPCEWIKHDPLVDQWWVYTSFLRECYCVSGVGESKIHTVGLGIDPQLFTPENKGLDELQQQTGNAYVFLFNGGITARKGVDILVNAYLNEFRADENVVLVIKGSPYYKQDLGNQIATLAQRSDIAKIIYFQKDMDPSLLPSLYRSAHCYVHPYRAEGYGLPIVEAMGCGLPVIVTGGGAARDFVDETYSYLLKCAVQFLDSDNVAGNTVVKKPFWIVPDEQNLRTIMRYVFNHRDEAHRKGMQASGIVREKHTWEKSALTIARILRESV